jgi:O-antigen/teichoic acid export membrane protein
MATDTAQGIGAQTLKGMFWSYGSFVGVRLASLLTTAVLARLLAPRDFGLIALATTFMAFLDMLQGLGVSQALVVSEPDLVEAEADTAFVVSTTVGVALFILSAALGPLAASLFHQPRLVEVMPALGLTFLMYGVSSTHYALAMRDIDFRSRTAAELADAITRGGVGIVLALAGLGVWSLIAGYVAGTVGLTVVLWRMVSWRPRWHPQRKHLRRLLTFGGALTGVSVMAAFLGQFDNALVGRVLGTTQLGFYSMAGRLPYILIISLAVATGQVMFPAFAKLDGEDLRRGYLIALRYTAAIALPLTAGLIVLARPITLIVFGSRWGPAVLPTQILCAWALMSPINMICGNGLRATNHATLLFMLAIPQAVALVVGSLLFVHQGIVAISWVQAAIAIVAQCATLQFTDRALGVSLRRVVRALAPPVLASLVLAAVFYGIDRTIGRAVPAVVLSVVVGGVIYLGLIYLLMPDLLSRLRSIIFGRSPPKVADTPRGDAARPVAVVAAVGKGADGEPTNVG